ncbi:MAG TPA: pyridoxal-phosphate dependent enzyme [Clostridiaceae bacterium]|nr:pyridoxal-phosphate dependent enzyme [Clostridiaceae bacterium]
MDIAYSFGKDDDGLNAMYSFRERLSDLIPELPELSPSIEIYPLGHVKCAELYCLRDDLIPDYLGGNKARKGFFYEALIRREKHDAVLTYGSITSNHARVISIIAKKLGIPCVIVSPESDQSSTNQYLSALFGSWHVYANVSGVSSCIDAELGELHRQFGNPIFIAGGGHDSTGTLAMVDLYFKINAFQERTGLFFDRIVFASGTGGTQAGLIVGNMLAEKDTIIHGVSIARDTERGIATISEAIMDVMNSAFDIRSCNITFDTDYIGGGYGRTTKDMKDKIRQYVVDYQLPLDFTYTGKAFYGMINLIDRLERPERILFIQTGGTPLFCDDLRRSSLT